MVSFGSPPGFACGLPVAARESARESAAMEAAFCSLAGSSCARTSSSTAPSWARFLSRSPGLVRSRSASCRSSSASWVRGSLALAPLPSRSFAISSMRSAWRCASSRTSRFCAMTRSIGFGRRIAGRTSAAATSAISAGRSCEARAGTATGPRPAAGRRASRRWRRTNRASASWRSKAPSTAIVSSSPASPDRRRPASRPRRPAPRRPHRPSRPRRPRPARSRRASAAPGPRGRAARAARTRGIARATSGACSSGSSRWAIARTSSGDGHDGGHGPGAPDGPAQPQPAPVDGEAATDRRQGGIELDAERRRVGRDERAAGVTAPGWRRDGRRLGDLGIRLHPRRAGGAGGADGSASAGSARRAGRRGRSGSARVAAIASEAARPVAVAARHRTRWLTPPAVHEGVAFVTPAMIWHEAPKPVSVPHMTSTCGDERVQPHQGLGRPLRQRRRGGRRRGPRSGRGGRRCCRSSRSRT